MNDVTRLIAIVCALLWGRTGGVKPNNIYCIGNQCFTVSKILGDFSAAQSECQDRGGNLMTVRSNASSRFWIGLHLPTGCPDRSAELKGVPLVAGDNESDFSNWPTTFNSSCSSHRCVSVSPADGFKWTREPCDTRTDGFLCECVNTAGGFQCVCKDGYRYKGGVCVDVNECTSAPCEHMCDNLPGSYVCSCYPGYKEDPEEPHRCKLHCGEEECLAECDPNDRYQCFCPEGYILGGEDNRTLNTYGSYVCICSPGYKLVDNYKCVIKNEVGPDEGSGASSTPPSLTTEPPDATIQPSILTRGGIVGIVLCTLFITALLMFLAYRVLCGKGKMESADGVKASENEAHTLQPVTSDA
uniref:Thrombomodulin n=1 Tax=Takifugu rubripes TaxID=31033 RepID=A0A674N0B9_TAKRU